MRHNRILVPLSSPFVRTLDRLAIAIGSPAAHLRVVSSLPIRSIPNFVYSVGWYGTVLRRDRSTGQLLTLFVPPADYRVTWETPLVFSPRDPHTLYYGSQFVLKTNDGGFYLERN